MMEDMSKVLVTGGSGFLAAHTIARLLVDGHEVSTTVRRLDRSPSVIEMLRTAGAPDADSVRFFATDLTADDGWEEAVDCQDFVLHVASPFPADDPEDENELIVPARDGALRVLRAASDSGVKRVVLTSSFAAIGYGAADPEHVFDEADWTDPDTAGLAAYIKSKAIAERAAWDYIDQEGRGTELTVINPVGIFGPALGPDFSTSIGIIKMMLDGTMAAAPPVWTNVVDVRDAADLHVRAMTAPHAAGQRYLAAAGDPISFQEIADALRANLGHAAAKAPTETATESTGAQQLPPPGMIRRISTAKARTELGWTSRSNEEAIVAAGESLVRLGLLG